MNVRWIQGLGTTMLPPLSCQSTLCKGRNEVQTLYPGMLLESLFVKGLAGVFTHLLVMFKMKKMNVKMNV